MVTIIFSHSSDYPNVFIAWLYCGMVNWDKKGQIGTIKWDKGSNRLSFLTPKLELGFLQIDFYVQASEFSLTSSSPHWFQPPLRLFYYRLPLDWTLDCPFTWALVICIGVLTNPTQLLPSSKPFSTQKNFLHQISLKVPKLSKFLPNTMFYSNIYKIQL